MPRPDGKNYAVTASVPWSIAALRKLATARWRTLAAAAIDLVPLWTYDMPQLELLDSPAMLIGRTVRRIIAGWIGSRQPIDRPFG
jgi:hypothetical protein